MRRIIGWLAATVAGSMGWWLGSKVGFAAAVIVSAVAAGGGLYAGYRWFDDHLA
jgi:hypothetical protein